MGYSPITRKVYGRLKNAEPRSAELEKLREKMKRQQEDYAKAEATLAMKMEQFPRHSREAMGGSS